jgi:hypothetical protein
MMLCAQGRKKAAFGGKASRRGRPDRPASGRWPTTLSKPDLSQGPRNSGHLQAAIKCRRTAQHGIKLAAPHLDGLADLSRAGRSPSAAPGRRVVPSLPLPADCSETPLPPVGKMLTRRLLRSFMPSMPMPIAACGSTCHSVAGYSRERSRRFRFAGRRSHVRRNCERAVISTYRASRPIPCSSYRGT